MGMNLCHYIDTHQSLLQPTPPYGDEQTAFELNYWSGVFQPTPPYGDEQKSNATNCRPRKFQPTPLQGGGERHTTNWKETIIYFNPHLPHGGWMDSWYLQTNHMITLQLTSPYGDEQEIILNWLFTVYIFQSTPPHGDELHSSMYTLLCYYFNPHPRMGMNDIPIKEMIELRVFQPTPPYGDELNGKYYISIHLNFNPHPRMGMNGTLQKTAVDSFVFQPTPPHGDEPVNSFILCFKPWHISTHTPAWGWTDDRCSSECICGITTRIPA